MRLIIIKYVPVLRYKTAEVSALKNITLSSKIMPLLELIQEAPLRSKKLTFKEAYIEELSNYSFPFMIDIPLYFNVSNSTNPKIKSFISQFKLNPSLKVDYYKDLCSNLNIIPVLSYGDNQKKCLTNDFKTDIKNLRPFFNKVAFRFFNTSDFTTILNDIESIICPDDILLFDIGKNKLNEPNIMKMIWTIISNTIFKTCTTVLIKSAINSNVIFKNMSQNNIVVEADNSLLKNYSSLGFDAFGDYAGVRRDTSFSKGGPANISVGFLYYSWHYNSYVGFKGTQEDYSEFISTVKPTLIQSHYWQFYGSSHNTTCVGCLNISNTTSKSSTDWKRYAIEHYISTLDQYL